MRVMLLRVHKAFMIVCILFCLLFAAVQGRSYRADHETAAAVRAGLSFLMALVLVVYRKKLPKQ